MPEVLIVLDGFRIGIVPGGSFPGPLQVGPLDISDLRDEDDLLAFQLAFVDQVAGNAANQALAGTVQIIGGGVDHVDTGEQSVLQRFSVLLRAFVDAVAAESETTDGDPCRSEGGKAV